MSKTSWLVMGSVGGLLVWLFAPALDGSHSFAFRDASHFYYPLFEWIRDEWGAGHWPWWNPHENLGTPLVAEGTSSVFYPGKLIFLLPLDYTLLLNWYTVSHVALAAWGAYRMPRRWQASPAAAGISALAYAFGASVLVQYCNVIFLVGAAWLPWALMGADEMLRARSWGAAAAFAAVLALMTTGGDPQMAYNAGLLATLFALILWRTERRDSGVANRAVGWRWSDWRPALLGGAAVLAALLAAVQVWPSMEGSPHSARASYDAPRTVYELCGSLWNSNQGDPKLAWYDSLIGRVYRGHQRHIYHFDVTPWSVVELAWPNVTGRRFPTYRQWMPLLGWDGNLWTPSLYMGLLPFSLAVVSWSVRRSATVETRWASWMVLLGALGSCGSYGLIWLLGIPLGGAHLLDIGSEVGGVYWWLTVLVPGYVYFRFPGKLFIVAALGLSLLAARGWDTMWYSKSQTLPRVWYALVALSLIGLGAMPWAWSYVEGKIDPLNYEELMGPFDAAGSWHDVVSGLLQTLVLAIALTVLLFWSRRQSGRAGAASCLAIALTVIDLGVAQKDLFTYAPASDWQSRPPLVDKLPADLATYRVYRDATVVSPAWNWKSSPDRYIEFLRWNRATLSPKFELPYGVSLSEAAEAVIAHDYSIVLDVARNQTARAAQGRLPAAAMLDVIAARVAIIEAGALREDIVPFDKPVPSMVAGLRPTALKRASIVHRVETLPQLTSHAPFQIRQRTLDVFFRDEQPRELRELAVIESDAPLDPQPEPPAASAADEQCEIVLSEPTRVEVDVRLASSGLVVLADQFYPGWEATVETGGQTRMVPIVRTNRVMRGVALPAGEHRLVFNYQPWSILGGGAISLATLVCLSGWAFAVRIRRRTSSAAAI